jgi:ferric-dicitrate binding protein FerR (iron transport regulator)
MKLDFHIPSLIVRSFQQKLNNVENDQLNHWLKVDEKNKTLYKKLKSIKNLDERKFFIQKLNKKQAWNRIDNSITIKKRNTISVWVRYAAIFILPMLIGSLLYWYANNKEIITQQQAINIPSGYSKAVLKMADGKLIKLESKQFKNLKEKDGTLISNNAKTLSFQSFEEKNTKLPLPIMEEISIPRTGEFHVILPDGTKVWLNSETVFEFPSRFTGKKRKVTLKKGEAFFEVSHDTEHPFIVETAKSVIQVLGTSFNIRAYEDEIENITTLVDGSINLRHFYDETSTIKLNPGDQASIISVNRRIKINNVNTQYYTAWKDGKFAFLNERLDNILKQLERWYNIETDFADEETKAYRFTGNLPRYDNISVILKMLQDVYKKVEFHIENRTILITKK